jgi:hypothetical protein
MKTALQFDVKAAGPFVPICPYDVLIIRPVPPEEKAKLYVLGRLKLFVHGGEQAFVFDPGYKVAADIVDRDYAPM